MLWREVVVMNPLQCHMQKDALMVNHAQTKVEPEGIPNLPSKQCELVNPGLTGATSPDSTDEGLQADDDACLLH